MGNGDSMDFQQHLAAAARHTDERLQHWLTGPAQAPVTSALTAQPDVPKRLAQAMHHAALGGGKRFRPFLVLESARLFDVDPDTAIDVAVALECIHCYSLVHDDLPAMDNDELRRGRPTVWKAFDEWTAILAGDALLTLAFEILAHPTGRITPRTQIALIHALAVASGRSGMVGGQQRDLDASKPIGKSLGRLTRKQKPASHAIMAMQAMKTGALIRFACVAGPILAERPLADETALAMFGQSLGLAFQISDDLLDVEGTTRAVGKAVAKDVDANKATLVRRHGIAAAREKLAMTIDTALATLTPYGRKADRLRDAARFMAERDR